MADTLTDLRTLRQSRAFDGQPIPADDLQQILDVARWTGSSNNVQPWQLIVVQNRDALRQIAAIRDINVWVEHASAAIAIALPAGQVNTFAYDEGRISERIMLAAKELGIGSGTAWFANDEQRAAGSTLLGLPGDLTVRSLVILGYATEPPTHRPGWGGRKPLDEIVSYETFGQREVH